MYVCKSQKKTFILDYMYIEWNLTLKKEILKSLNQDIESEFLGTFKLFLIQKKKRKEGYDLFWKLSPQNILIQR